MIYSEFSLKKLINYTIFSHSKASSCESLLQAFSNQTFPTILYLSDETQDYLILLQSCWAAETFFSNWLDLFGNSSSVSAFLPMGIADVFVLLFHLVETSG